MPFIAEIQPLPETEDVMKKPTLKSSVQSAFSLVELLVVIAVIAVIAAIAIPNIAGITGQAAATTAKRNAQNLASVASAARAAGWTNSYGDEGAFCTALTNGSVSNSLGVFRVDGLSAADMTNAQGHLTFSNVQGGLLIYSPTN